MRIAGLGGLHHLSAKKQSQHGGGEFFHHFIESASHVHHTRWRDHLRKHPNHGHHCVQRQSAKGNEKGYPHFCLYCRTNEWCVWSLLESAKHGWSGLVTDALGKNPSTAVITDQKFIDPATRCERRDGVHNRHKKECTSKIKSFSADCDYLRANGHDDLLVHQLRNHHLPLRFEYFRKLAEELHGPIEKLGTKQEDGSYVCTAMLPWFPEIPLAQQLQKMGIVLTDHKRWILAGRRQPAAEPRVDTRPGPRCRAELGDAVDKI